MVGQLLRSWRELRRASQEHVAARAGVSPRHLSCVETGKAAPGREVLLAIAGALDVPLRERNELLLAAGFAPAYPTRPLASAALAAVRQALDHVLASQDPYPVIVFDRRFELLEHNAAAARMFARLEAPPLPPEIARNLMLTLLHPLGWRARIANWPQIASALVERLHRAVAAAPGDHALGELRDQVLALPGVPATWRRPRPEEVLVPFVPVHLAHGGVTLRLFTMLATVGTPLDVTAAELFVETYFPADADTAAQLRAWAASP
jgi:transcriptional regulator with XRE-family HTH domain